MTKKHYCKNPFCDIQLFEEGYCSQKCINLHREQVITENQGITKEQYLTIIARIKQLEEDVIYWKKAHLNLQGRVYDIEKEQTPEVE